MGCTPNILPLEISVQNENDEIMVLIPLISPHQFNTIATLGFTIKDQQNVPML